MKNLKISNSFNENIKKGTCFALSIMMVGLLSGKVSASNEETQVTTLAHIAETNLEVYTGINIYINDKSFTPTDVNGNLVYPFVYNGTTYLPVRAISETFGADVKWDAVNKRVNITKNNINITNNSKERKDTTLSRKTVSATTGVEVYINNELLIPTDVYSNPVEVYVIDGTTYLPLRALANAFNVDITWESSNNGVYLGRHISNNNYYYIWPNQEGYVTPKLDSPHEELVNRYLVTFETWDEYRNKALEKKKYIAYNFSDYSYLGVYTEYQEKGYDIGQKYMDLDIAIGQEILDIYNDLDSNFNDAHQIAFQNCKTLYEELKANKDAYKGTDRLPGAIMTCGREIKSIIDALDLVSEEKEANYIRMYDELYTQFQKELVSLNGISRQKTI